jgi:hypothetical protein
LEGGVIDSRCRHGKVAAGEGWSRRWAGTVRRGKKKMHNMRYMRMLIIEDMFREAQEGQERGKREA